MPSESASRMPTDLDSIDIRILEQLQRNGSMPNNELAERVGLSPAPCWRRVKRLEEAGVIRQRVALLDGEAVGLALTVFASVKLAHHTADAISLFEAAVLEFPEVTECYTVSGGTDFLLRIVTTSMRSYETFLRENILRLPGVSEVQSRFVVTQVKYTTELPVRLGQREPEKRTRSQTGS